MSKFLLINHSNGLEIESDSTLLDLLSKFIKNKLTTEHGLFLRDIIEFAADEIINYLDVEFNQDSNYKLFTYSNASDKYHQLSSDILFEFIRSMEFKLKENLINFITNESIK